MCLESHRLRESDAEILAALRVSHELPLFMMVAITLQIPQATVYCRFSRIHTRTDVFRF